MSGDLEDLLNTTTNCNYKMASDVTSDTNQAKLDTLEKKAVHLRLILEKDFKAADLKWSLFVAAAFSFRYESCLRPFPPTFMKNGVKDMDNLLNVLTDVPALDLFLQQLDDLENLASLSDIIELLFYVLVRLKEPCLKTVPSELHNTILADVPNAPKPQYIFQLCSSKSSHSEMKWKEISKNYKTFYAYHGTRLENFYSMLHFGFQQQMYKNTPLGNGFYLSSDLNISIPHSHGGFGWGASSIGGHLSCIAMCEVIDTPDGINYKKPMTDDGDAVTSDDRNSSSDNASDAKMIHYLVSNSDLLRVRYLLVYAKQPTSIRFGTSNINRNEGGFKQWLSRHKLISILFSYGLLLATVGFANNQPINYYYKMFLKKLDFAYATVKV